MTPLIAQEMETRSPYERFVGLLPMLGKGSLALFSQALISGSNFVISIFLARWLAPGQYGSYTLVISLFFFLSGFHNALLLEPMGVLGPARYRGCLPAYLGKLVRLHFAIALVLMALVAIGASAVPLLSRVHGLSDAMWGACLAIPWILFFWFLRQAAYLDLRSDLAARAASAYAVVVLSMLFFLRFSSRLTPFSAFLTQAVASVIAGIFLMAWIRPRLFSPPDTVGMLTIWTQHWRYGRWIAVTTLVYWLSGQAFYFIAAALLKMEDVGTVSALQNFVAPLSQFVTACSLLLLPWASARFATRDGASFERAIKRISLMFVAAGLVYFASMVVFGRWLTLFFYHGKYVQSAGLIPVLALSTALIAAAQGPAIGLRAMQVPSRVFFGYSVAAAFSIPAGFALTHYWGLVGNVLGMAASSLCFFLAVTGCYRSTVKGAGLRDRAAHPYRDATTVDAATVGRTRSATTTRVAWLIPSLARGNYMQPLFSEFAKLFPNTIVFTGVWPGFVPEYVGKFRLRCLPGYRFVTLQQGTNGYGRGFFWPPFSVIRELFRFRPNAIFTSGFSLWTVYALAFKALTGSRVILLWEGTSPTVAYLNSPVRLRIRRFMAALADAGISNMRLGIEYLRDELAVPDSKLLHHPYEVPEPSLLCAGFEATGLGRLEHPVFLFVGSIIPRKGWSCLLHAGSILLERGFERFSLIFVGTGDQERDLQEQISSHGLGSLARQVGQVAYRNLGAYYRAADVFVFPTYEDTWGLVLLEAMAFGKPVLCSKYAGSREIVRHGVNGFIFDPYNPEELAVYMEQFIQDPRLGPEFGKCSSEMMASHTPSRAANVMGSLVARVMNRTRGAVMSLAAPELSSE
jgi:glycosyltransferase involved in cell wall biosynthesis/O-antigen/teichoic acid export membrane protein